MFLSVEYLSVNDYIYGGSHIVTAATLSHALQDPWVS